MNSPEADTGDEGATGALAGEGVEDGTGLGLAAGLGVGLEVGLGIGLGVGLGVEADEGKGGGAGGGGEASEGAGGDATDWGGGGGEGWGGADCGAGAGADGGYGTKIYSAVTSFMSDHASVLRWSYMYACSLRHSKRCIVCTLCFDSELLHLVGATFMTLMPHSCLP